MKEYYIKNREKIREKQKRYYENNYQEIIKRSKQRYKDNPQKAKIYQKLWKKSNPEKVKKYHNPEKEREWNRRSFNKTRRNDQKYKLNSNMRKAMGISLRGNKNGRHWETLVDYTLNDLIKHLKRTIPENYTWGDLFNGKLHIDHIIPISAFNFTKPEHADFKRCWTLENLQLLPKEENLRKSYRLLKPFQPALKI